jgi:hypothetical protein
MKRRANNLRVWASLAAVCIVILGALGADNTGPVNSIVCEGVVVETIERATPPSTGWMNSADDAANQVVQIVAANQRRNMAAISAGRLQLEEFYGKPRYRR